MLNKLHQIWSAGVPCIYMPLDAAQLVRYSWFYLYALIRSAPVRTVRGFMGFIYAHSYGQLILSQGNAVLWVG